MFIHERVPVGHVAGLNFDGGAVHFPSVTYGGPFLPDEFSVSGSFAGHEVDLRGHTGFVMETPVFGVPVDATSSTLTP